MVQDSLKSYRDVSSGMSPDEADAAVEANIWERAEALYEFLGEEYDLDTKIVSEDSATVGMALIASVRAILSPELFGIFNDDLVTAVKSLVDLAYHVGLKRGRQAAEVERLLND